MFSNESNSRIVFNNDLNENYENGTQAAKIEISTANSEIPLDDPAAASSSLPLDLTTRPKPLLKKSKSYGSFPRSVRFKPDDELIETLISPEQKQPRPTRFDDSKTRHDRLQATRRRRTLISLILISSINLLNYTDRYILGSVLIDVEEYFNVDKSMSGLLHTLFLLSFTLAAPLVGFLGDRRSIIQRKHLVISSCLVWSACVLAASFSPSSSFALFIILRCLFGAASAFYECIALPIVSDLFTDETSRRRALFLFYLGPPVGVGLGFLVANTIRNLLKDDWRWSMRVTPGVLLVLTLATVFFFHEPERRPETTNPTQITPLRGSSLTRLVHNRTYILIVLASSFAVCTLVGFNWWSPSLIAYMLVSDLQSPEAIYRNKQVYSIVQTLAGALGTLFPTEVLTRLPTSKYPLAPLYLLTSELAASSFSLFLYLFLAGSLHPIVDLLFYAVFTFFINSWRLITAGVLLDIVDSSSRARANSILLFALHLLGDALAPFWIGAVNDLCWSTMSVNSIDNRFYCTQLSLYPLVIIVFASAAVSLFSTLTFQKDRI